MSKCTQCTLRCMHSTEMHPAATKLVLKQNPAHAHMMFIMVYWYGMTHPLRTLSPLNMRCTGWACVPRKMPANSVAIYLQTARRSITHCSNNCMEEQYLLVSVRQ
jgi:hypothetical protein